MDYCKVCGNIGHKTGLCTTDIVDISYKAPGDVNTVELFTSLNNWMSGDEMSYQKQKDMYVIHRGFPVGQHQFKFRIDKKYWAVSDNYQTIEVNGNLNNVLNVHLKNGESVLVQSNILSQYSLKNTDNLMMDVKILLNEISINEMFERNGLKYKNTAHTIEVWSSWNDWKIGEEMDGSCDKNSYFTIYALQKKLKRGIYEYKFKIDGKWMVDPYRMTNEIEGIINHVLNLENELEFDLKELEEGIIAYDVVSLTAFSHEKLTSFDLTGHSLTTIGGRLWMFGGKDRDSFTNNMFKIEFHPFKVKLLEMYDPNGPSPIGFHKAWRYGEKLILYGGHDNKRVSDSYHTYSTLYNTWTKYKFATPLIRESYSVVHKKFTSRLYIFGGLYCSPDDEAEIHFNDLHVLFLNLMRFKKLYTKDAPCGRYGHSASLINWTMFVFGGCRTEGLSKTCFNDIYKINLFDHEDLLWEEIKIDGPKPAARYGHLCVQFGTQMIIYGGCNGSKDEHLLGDLWVFGIITNVWTPLRHKDQNLDYRRTFHAGSMINNSLIVFGGKTAKNNPLFDKFLKFDFEF